MNEILKKNLRTILHVETDIREIKKLHGDASYRTYYRMTLVDGSSYIVMEMPKGRASASEEITNYKGPHDELPFINVARYLSSHQIPVPRVYHYDSENRLMILEDLGDDLMARRVENAGDSARIEWYKKAIDLLSSLQQKTKGDSGSECVALKRSFDATLLNWEFDHFLEYGIEAKLNLKMDPADLKIFKDETRAITAKIEKMPYGFTHRDFQSRNILVRDGALNLIDFQDALLGPYIYDLVALTRDSYVKLSNKVLEELVKYYSSKMGLSFDKVAADFNLVTVQRKLKDAGRFVYIDRVKGNPNFLKYIPTSLEYVKNALQKIPEHIKLFDTLKKYVPEWK